MEVPESCSARMDEMCETACTIKTEVLAELNVTCKRLHQISSDFVNCNTLKRQVSSYRSTFRAKVKSHTSCRKQQQAENDVSMACAKFLNAMKVIRTLLCERESLTADVADLMPICAHSAKETLGMWLEDMAEMFEGGLQSEKDVEAEGGCQRYLPQFLYFQLC